MTREEKDPLQFLVVKEKVEGPQGALLPVGVRVQVRVITVQKNWGGGGGGGGGAK